jgi:hypothetical protein
MSYSILYRSMFVKLSDGRFIPMMEMGDNNVWDCNYGRGRGRRSRSWSNINLNRGQKFFTESEIKKFLEEWNNDFEAKRQKDLQSDEEWLQESAKNANFGFYEAISVYGKGGTNGTAFKDVKNIVLSGVKNCISVEEAIKKCGLKITYWKKEEGDIALTCWKSEHFETEEEMFKVINEKFGGDEKNFYFVYNENYLTSRVYKMKKAIKNFANGKGKNVKPFMLTCGKRGVDKKYYVRLDKVGFSLTEDWKEATLLRKYESGGISLTDILYSQFDIDYVHYGYDFETGGLG